MLRTAFSGLLFLVLWGTMILGRAMIDIITILCDNRRLSLAPLFCHRLTETVYLYLPYIVVLIIYRPAIM